MESRVKEEDEGGGLTGEWGGGVSDRNMEEEKGGLTGKENW
jgi:hypothetical protein